MKMQIYKLTFFIIFQFFVCGLAPIAAQEKESVKLEQTTNFELINSQQPIDSLSVWSFGLGSGYQGFKELSIYDLGFKVGKSIKMGHRVQFQYSYRTSKKNFDQSWGNTLLNMETEIGSHIVGLGYEYFPFVANKEWLPQTNSWWSRQLQSLKVKGGVMYVENPNYNFNSSLRSPLTLGGFTFTTDEVGSIQTNIATNKVQPFLGFGHDGFYIGEKVVFVFEAGIVYQGKPTVTMTATNLLEPTAEVASVLERNLADYKVIPFVQFHIQIRLN
jgi:hypothetical protein